MSNLSNKNRPLIVGHMPRLWPILDGKGTWYLADTFKYYSPLLQMTIVIPAGEYNDLASILFGRNLFPVNDAHKIAAIIHDYLYKQKGKLPEVTITRSQADAILEEAMTMLRMDVYNSYSTELITHIQSSKFGKDLIAHMTYLDKKGNSKKLVPAWRRKLMWAAVKSGGWYFWNKLPQDVGNE